MLDTTVVNPATPLVLPKLGDCCDTEVVAK